MIMDTPKPPQKPAQLLHDLESIRELLGDNGSEPPLLIDSLDPDSIPVLSDIVSAPPGPPPRETLREESRLGFLRRIQGAPGPAVNCDGRDRW